MARKLLIENISLSAGIEAEVSLSENWESAIFQARNDNEVELRINAGDTKYFTLKSAKDTSTGDILQFFPPGTVFYAKCANDDVLEILYNEH